jgi:hypothetical protein
MGDLFNLEMKPAPTGPEECLGMTFVGEEEYRKHFLTKLRERSLLKEFEDYRASSQKRLKVFRLEAVRAGLQKAWQERDYATIISAVARKIPENVLQEDPKLLMRYDQAVTRSGDE